MKALAIDHLDQHQANRATHQQAGQHADTSGQRAFLGQHPADLAAGQAEVAQHAELPTTRRGQRGETGRHAGQTDGNGDGFQQISHRKRPVKNPQTERPDFARPGDFEHAGPGHRGQRCGHLIGIGPRGQINRRIVDQPISGQAAVVVEIDHDGAGLP